MRAANLLLLMLLLATAPSWAAEHPALAQARALYNTGDFDGAITAAAAARSDPASAAAAALVTARSHLERFRLRSDATDLLAARDALNNVRAAALSPRDYVDLLVGLGQALFLGETFGAAAELFDSALDRGSLLGARDRLLLLDWWATALDREAQRLNADRRPALLALVVTRMESELRQDAGNAPANYWLAVAARGAGDVERAWQAAIAGWVRARLNDERAEALRTDLDRFVTQVLISERARLRPIREQQEALTSLRAEWDSVKSQWK